MNYIGWVAALTVLAAVLTGWMEPSSSGLIHSVVLALGTAWAVLSLLGRTEPRLHWLALSPLSCAAWGLLQISMKWTVYPYETWSSVTGWMTLAVLFSAGYAGFETSDSLERLQTTAIWFGGFYSFVAICQWYTGGGKVLWLIQTPYDSDIAGTFGNRDHYAALIALLLPVALARIVAGRHSGLIAAACAGLMFASVLACGSRAGTLVVCAEALIFVGVACFGRRRNVPAAALVAVSLALCTAIGGWTLVWERFASGNFLSHRREMLTSTIHMIQARPLTGFGLGSWPTVYPAFAVFDPPGIYMNHAHNDWAEWASDGGLLLALGLAVVAVAAAVNCRKNLWSLGIPAVFVHAMADFPLHKPAIACAVFFLAGASFSRRTVTEAKQAAGFDSCEPQLPSMRLRSQNSRS